MALQFSLLDVFADQAFQGTQIPVVILKDQELSEAEKIAVAGELRQNDTVFLEVTDSFNRATVYDSHGRARLGAHTTLAAAFAAWEQGLVEDCGGYYSYTLLEDGEKVSCYIDKAQQGVGRIQFSRSLNPVMDRFTPSIERIAATLNVEPRHITFSKYQPALASVDRPTLVVPFTRPQHVLAARLDFDLWAQMQSEVYATGLFLFAPGSVTADTNFHGRLLTASTADKEYPPIGGVMPEFIAYLHAQDSFAEGTHSFSVDRGDFESRQSVLHVEFDKRRDHRLQCRIGGQVIKMGSGALFYP